MDRHKQGTIHILTFMNPKILEVVKNNNNFAQGKNHNNNTTTSNLEISEYFLSPKICRHLFTGPIY